MKVKVYKKSLEPVVNGRKFLEKIKNPTNADMIRQLSDENLSDFLKEIEIGRFGPFTYGKIFCNTCLGQHKCDECRLWWLKQPADITMK